MGRHLTGLDTVLSPAASAVALARLRAWRPASSITFGPVWPVTAVMTNTLLPCTWRMTASTSQPPATVVKPDFTPMTPWVPSNGV